MDNAGQAEQAVKNPKSSGAGVLVLSLLVAEMGVRMVFGGGGSSEEEGCKGRGGEVGGFRMHDEQLRSLLSGVYDGGSHFLDVDT